MSAKQPVPVTFESLGLPAPLVTALTRLGYEEPTPIQREAIPALLAGKDVLGQAATGTGKTAAFALPLLSRLQIGKCKQFETCALVLVPTRELALQVTEAIRKYGSAMGVSVLAVYGGEEIGKQLKPLRKGVDIVVATPGRAIDHLKRKSLLLTRVGTVVLDEADEMLDMGFAEDLETILDALPEKRQTALFSATMPSRILKIAERHLTSPVRVSIARQVAVAGEAPKVRQTAYVVPRRFKTVALMRIFQLEKPQSALIFCRTRDEVDELSSMLIQQGEPAAALHGGLDQVQRDRVMKKFKTSAVKFLVATDVAARGLHIENLSHVINYDVPNSPEAYVHRIGRTGRAGREGAAITLAEPQETRLLQGLERAVGSKIGLAKVPTPEELRAHQLKHTRDTVLEAARAKKGESLKPWISELASELDPTDLAAAAIELLHAAQHGAQPVDEIQIPTWAAPRPSAARRTAAHPPTRQAHAPARASHAPARREDHRPAARDDRPALPPARREDRRPAAHDDRPAFPPTRREDRHDRPPQTFGAPRTFGTPQRGGFQKRPPGGGEEKITLWIGAGEQAGIRPQDLVGAIANEAKLDSKQIGPIQIREGFSLVGVPAGDVDRVVAAMRNTTLRGRRVQVRRER
ncbi:MAG: heavy metal transporter [Myxococcaceae bacterium]|nr:heavy metal transporter [Myxococcaceae bacterium]